MNHPNGITSGDSHGGHPLGNPRSFPPQQQPQQQQQQQYSQQQQPQQQQQYSQHPQQPQQQYPQQSQFQSHSQAQSSGPRAKCDQVVFEAIAKAAEIVVASRCFIENDPAGAGVNGSGRFNLLVPEVKSVRTILQRWKRTMHVPLRLDVYYQHPPTPEHQNGERELLERWCLEYAPTINEYKSQNNNPRQSQSSRHNTFDSDPIVQLRKVCKNIVVWLRTLYCHSRLLPAQALRKTHGSGSGRNDTSNIGFSIYVVGEGQDDVGGLVRQGFDNEPKHSGTTGGMNRNSGVPTPYGVLGWKVYLAPKQLVRKLLALEREQARLLQQQQQYANTAATATATNTNMSATRSIPIAHGTATTPPNHTNSTKVSVARSAPTHNPRGYRRANSDGVATHTHLDPNTHYQQQQRQERQQFHRQQQHQQQQQRYYSRSPSRNDTLPPSSATVAPRSYHQTSEFQKRYADNAAQQEKGIGNNNNNNRGIYNDSADAPQRGLYNDAQKSAAPSSATNSTNVGIKKSNLSALSLALMGMKDPESSSPPPSATATEPSHQQTPEKTNSKTTDNENTTHANTNATAGDEFPSFSEKRRAALHNAPPCSAAAAATGVGEYGYAYNHQQQQQMSSSPGNASFPHKEQQQHQHQHHPNLSSSPRSFHHRGPSTPASNPSSTFGTTPPGYLLSQTPSVGSYTHTPGGGILLPPRSSAAGSSSIQQSPSSPQALAPPFVRSVGFAGQQSESSPLQQQQQLQSPSQHEGSHHHARTPSADSATNPHAFPQTVEAPKPSLDLLHSSPFHNSVLHGSTNTNTTSTSANTSGHPLQPRRQPQKDGLSSFLQAEETASMEAATTFINDFYHHHYPMADSHMASTEDHYLHHPLSSDYDYGRFVEGSSSSAAAALSAYAYLEHGEPQDLAEDMPFAVEGIGMGSGLSSGVAGHGQASLGSLRSAMTMATNPNEASLMVASMGMVPQKKLALFESSSHTNIGIGASGTTTADADAEDRNGNCNGTIDGSVDVDVDALTDQLAGFRSFGATLSSPSHPAAAPLMTASVGSGG